MAGRRAVATFAAFVAVACSRAGGKVNDSAGGSGSDSASASQAAPPTQTPAPSTPAVAPIDSPKSSGAPAPARAETAATPAPRATPSETVLTGKVVAGGLAGAPETSLQIEGGKPTMLFGPLEPELRRLAGATVWVTGSPGGRAPNATFTVSRYEIVSIDGAKPLVGLIAVRDGATWLAMERDTLKLVGAAAELTAKPGAKVWIVGRRSGKDVVAQTYGVIREP